MTLLTRASRDSLLAHTKSKVYLSCMTRRQKRQTEISSQVCVSTFSFPVSRVPRAPFDSIVMRCVLEALTSSNFERWDNGVCARCAFFGKATLTAMCTRTISWPRYFKGEPWWIGILTGYELKIVFSLDTSEWCLCEGFSRSLLIYPDLFYNNFQRICDLNHYVIFVNREWKFVRRGTH